MRPLIGDPSLNKEAAHFHVRVFRKYGNLCYFGESEGHPKRRATDSAHIIGRAHLGVFRYADERLARPACRTCHDKQGAGLLQFDYEDYRLAVKVHNDLESKLKIHLVDRVTYYGGKRRRRRRAA